MKSLADNPAVRRAIRESADPKWARQRFEELTAIEAGVDLKGLSGEQLRILASLFGGSEAMSLLLMKRPAWVEDLIACDDLRRARKEEGLRRELGAVVQSALESRDYAVGFAGIREFKQRQMLRITARDLARLGEVTGITAELTALADVCLDSVLRLCQQRLVDRFGSPYHLDPESRWQPTHFAVLGMGKLGGRELNYSSDVDLMFLYSDEGNIFPEPPRRKGGTGRGLTNHQFFKRLVESFVAEVTMATPEGSLYRVDLRLRPEGEAGPLVRSFESYETFYAQWGQTWERMMLIKTRGVAGDRALAAEFLEMIQPFRYPRSLSEGAVDEIAAMKARIETEVVKSGEMERNVKLGRGGIREIEFIAQTTQLLSGGRLPFLQGPATLPALEKMARYRLLGEADSQGLAQAYCFLRDVEHRLQMENNLQTHTIPTSGVACERLARSMGFSKYADFEKALRTHSQHVRRIYDQLVNRGGAEKKSSFPTLFRGAEEEWQRILKQHGFQDLERSFRLLQELVQGPGYVHVSRRTFELGMKLVPRLFALCPGGKPVRDSDETENRSPVRVEDGSQATGSREEVKVLSDPDRVLARLDSFITAYGARAVLFEVWARNVHLFQLQLLLFDRSEFLAEMAIGTPDLVDELVLSGRLRRSKTAAEILKDLQHGREDKDQRVWIRRYHRAEFMRIGLRCILGLADSEQGFLELTALADACLQYALEVALRTQRLRVSPLVIVGLGKLGGQELTCGSDLDIVFVADDRVKSRLPRLQKLASTVMDLLSGPSDLGIVFETDARLRPDGETGLLVNTFAAYESYYRRRAQLWEIQALTRARPIAGDLELGERFVDLIVTLTDFRARVTHAAGKATVRNRKASGGLSGELAAFTADWKGSIAKMRQRIEKERTPPGQDAFAFKTGKGGLIDAEFIAQMICLEQGWREPNTLRVLERVVAERLLPRGDGEMLLENYRPLRRLESILRLWSFEGEAVLPSDPAAYRRVATRCGFGSAEALQTSLAGWRKAIREVYQRVLGE